MNIRYKKGILDNIYVVRLYPGTDLVKGLEQFAEREGITHGVIVSMLGTLDQGALRNPHLGTWLPIEREYEGADQIDTTVFERPVEIVGGAGNLLPREGKVEAHIHLIVSQDGGKTLAGHLWRGRVWTQAEVFVARLSGLDDVTRKFEPDTGLWQIQIPDQG